MRIELRHIDLPVKDLRATIDEESLDELADSLRDRGQKQAICVRPIRPSNNGHAIHVDPRQDFDGFIESGGRFEVVYGARRYRAANLIGWSEINAEIAESDSDIDTAADKLIENVQRQDLTAIEEAYGLLELIGDGEADVRKLQRQTGKSRSWILTRLDLVAMPEDMQGALQAGVISIGVARELSLIDNAEIREQYTRHAVENGCTAELARIWVSQSHAAAGALVAIDELATREDLHGPKPGTVDQHYDCFICQQTNSWRRINTLVICAPCQEVILSQRHTSVPDPIPTPLDSQF